MEPVWHLHDQPLGSGVTVATTPNSVPINTDWAVYAIVDQLVWRVPNSKDPKGIGIFGRVMGGPTEQNLVDFYSDGGVTFSGMIPHRAEDTLGVGFAYTDISNEVHGFDGGQGIPSAGNFQALLEICYTAKLKTGLEVHPRRQVKGPCRTRRCGAFALLSISDSSLLTLKQNDITRIAA